MPQRLGQLFAPQRRTGTDTFFQPSCWSYGWTSNKHKHFELHVVRAYALELAGGSNKLYRCVGIADSTPFQISSAKRLQTSIKNGTVDVLFPEIGSQYTLLASKPLRSQRKRRRIEDRGKRTGKERRAQHSELQQNGAYSTMLQNEIMEQSLFNFEDCYEEGLDNFDEPWL